MHDTISTACGQRKVSVRELVNSIAWPRSLRAVARVLVTVAQFMCLIVAPIPVASSARAQTPERLPSVDRFANFIAEASTRFTVPVRWIRAIIQIESAGDEHAISPRGAMGLMQLMPATWVELSVRYQLGLDPFDSRDNILAGHRVSQGVTCRFGSAGFLAAYHAGPARYEQQ